MTEFSRRDIGRGALAASALVAMGGSSVGAIAAETKSAIDPLDYVHPQLRPIAARIQQMVANQPPLSLATLPSVRTGNTAFVKPPRNDVSYTERRIPVRGGAPDVKIYIINAKPGTSRPGILHTHGGGFVAGAAKDDIFRLQNMASELDVVIVTVEYRLAPETRWSGSIEDNYAGLKWLSANAGELGADRTKIAVMGESAGGGHAALLAITARDRGEVPIAFQCLVYPMLDDRTGSSRPTPPTIGQFIWTAPQNRFGWASFLGTAPGARAVPPAVPARLENLKGLPPTWIGTGSIDLFAPEDLEYGRRLIEAGVMTEMVVVPGAFHGFDGIPDLVNLKVPISMQFNANKMTALRRALFKEKAV